jgi:cytochrome oxidase Cu insertion factor (SCO1/SenC/PrrC family)
MRGLAAGLSVLLVLSSAGCASMKENRLASRLRSQPLPDFELEALDGGSVRLSDLRGKPVVLAFFAHG